VRTVDKNRRYYRNMEHTMPEILIRIGPIDLRDDNILVLQMEEGIEISEDDVKEIFTAVSRLTSEKLPLIIIAGSHSLSHYAQTHLFTIQAVSKVAMVLERKLTRHMYESLTRVFKPVYEMRVFHALDEALIWLKEDDS